MRHLQRLKQLFLFTCCLLRRCFCKNFFFFFLFSWKEEIRLLEACCKEAQTMWTGFPVLALPC